jgi:hypothetical protein
VAADALDVPDAPDDALRRRLAEAFASADRAGREMLDRQSVAGLLDTA